MGRRVPDARLLDRGLEDRPEGATLIEVAAQLSPWAPQRTVQRWLAALVRENRATRTGAGVGIRYGLPAFAGESFTDTRLPTSPEGAAVRQLVRQPRERRYAADYRRVIACVSPPPERWRSDDRHPPHNSAQRYAVSGSLR